MKSHFLIRVTSVKGLYSCQRARMLYYVIPRGVKPLGREVYLRIRGAVTLLPPHVFTVCTGSSWLSLYLLN